MAIRPAAFLYLAWLPFWEARKNPCAWSTRMTSEDPSRLGIHHLLADGYVADRSVGVAGLALKVKFHGSLRLATASSRVEPKLPRVGDGFRCLRHWRNQRVPGMPPTSGRSLGQVQQRDPLSCREFSRLRIPTCKSAATRPMQTFLQEALQATPAGAVVVVEESILSPPIGFSPRVRKKQDASSTP